MMQGLMGRAVAVAAVVMLASPIMAKDGRVDKVEDRIDRAENATDEGVDRGRRDVAEDKADASSACRRKRAGSWSTTSPSCSARAPRSTLRSSSNPETRCSKSCCSTPTRTNSRCSRASSN